MDEASYEVLETPPKKDKSPGNNATDEEENTATADDAEKPTKIDVAEATQSSQEQPPPGETRPDETDDGISLPTPDARQSPNFVTTSEKIQKKTT